MIFRKRFTSSFASRHFLVSLSAWPITVGAYEAVIELLRFSSVSGGGAKHFEASYLVLTKNFTVSDYLLKVNGGYGFGILSASHHELEGVFGGLSIAHQDFSNYELILENDSRDINAGIKALFWDRLQLLALVREMKYLEGSISYHMLMK